MNRDAISTNLAYLFFGLFLVAGIALFAAVLTFAPATQDPVVAAPPPKTKGGPAQVQVPANGSPVETGRALFQTKACVSCHVIDGYPGAVGTIGPELTNIASQAQIAGVLPMSPENMQRWLADPPAVKPGTAMPDLGLTDDEVAALTEYLFTLQ